MSTAKKVYRNLLRKMPIVPALYLIYFRGYRKILNLNKPKYFGEKIQWLKLYGGLEELSPYVDKYEVRKYVADTIGSEHLNTLIGVYNSPNEIDYDKLPNKFVIKSTNGSGTIIICKDKSKLNIAEANNKMSKWLKDDYSLEKKELQYKNVNNKIIIEKYIEDDSGELRDYKVYCFNGKALYFGVFSARFSDERADFYDANGNILNNVRTGGVKNSKNPLKLDKGLLSELMQLSEKLSKPFSFVRVDFYIVNNKIIFGELTFTDGAGSDAWSPLSFDLEIASKIPMNKVLRESAN